ncbi:MAG: hypothetical protein WC753_04480 [Candidatus Gracilibacteria bacterium]|jgi:hypothetical protein
MKWIIISIACGVVGFMMYSTYSSISTQLESSAIGTKPAAPAPAKVSVEKVEKTLIDTKNQIKK